MLALINEITTKKILLVIFLTNKYLYIKYK